MDVFHSRKMVYFLATLVVIALGTFTDVNPELLEKIIYFGMVAIGGQAFADGWTKGKTSSAAKSKAEE